MHKSWHRNQVRTKYHKINLIVSGSQILESVYLIKSFEVFKQVKEITPLCRRSRGKNKIKREKTVSDEYFLDSDLNVCEVFHNNDHVKIKINFTSLKEELNKLNKSKKVRVYSDFREKGEWKTRVLMKNSSTLADMDMM